jgi:hypothetical protein
MLDPPVSAGASLMYFYITLIFGIVFLISEVIALRELPIHLRIHSWKLKFSVWVFLLGVGLVFGYFCSLAEYPSPFADQADLTYYSFPILTGTTDGKKDFWSIFTLPALFINYVIGLLAPAFIATTYSRYVLKTRSPQG